MPLVCNVTIYVFTQDIYFFFFPSLCCVQTQQCKFFWTIQDVLFSSSSENFNFSSWLYLEPHLATCYPYRFLYRSSHLRYSEAFRTFQTSVMFKIYRTLTFRLPLSHLQLWSSFYNERLCVIPVIDLQVNITSRL